MAKIFEPRKVVVAIWQPGTYNKGLTKLKNLEYINQSKKFPGFEFKAHSQFLSDSTETKLPLHRLMYA